MPEGLAGGARTWRQFLRYRRRRQDLLEEADDATTKRATATAHLHTLDAQRTALRQELAQVSAGGTGITWLGFVTKGALPEGVCWRR